MERPGSVAPAAAPLPGAGAPPGGVPSGDGGSPGLEPTAAAGTGEAAASGSTGHAGVDPVLLLAGVWLLGALLVLANLLVGRARVRWLARDAERVRDGPWEDLRERVAERLGLDRKVVLLRGVRPLVPMTWGIVRPRVMLPETADTWPRACRENVLLHELAHVKRRDCLVQLLVRLACAVYWFHPLVWHAVRRLRLEQEEACDDHVLRAGTRASDYARQLVGLARLLKAVRTPAHAGRTDFGRRMRALLDGGRSRRELGRRAAAALASAVEHLRRLEPEHVVPWLMTLAYRDASPTVQRRVVAELASLDRDGVDTSLMQIARSHPEKKVRLEAIIWLLRTGSGQALSKYVENA